jgi:hypothetical protein
VCLGGFERKKFSSLSTLIAETGIFSSSQGLVCHTQTFFSLGILDDGRRNACPMWEDLGHM